MELAFPKQQQSKYAVQLDAVSAEDLNAVIDLEAKKNVVPIQFPQHKYVKKEAKRPHVI